MGTIRYTNLLAISVLLISSCINSGHQGSSHQIPEVSDDFIEDVMVARICADFEWVYDNTYRYDPSTRLPKPSNPDVMASTDREHVRELLKGKCDYEVTYLGNRARLIVDISRSGFVEWFNVNVVGRPPDYWPSRYDASYRSRLEYLVYSDGRWWIDPGGVMYFGPPATPDEPS